MNSGNKLPKEKKVTKYEMMLETSGKKITFDKDLNTLKNSNTSTDIQKNIGASLKKIRSKYGLTQNELAELVGVSGTTIKHYENGFPQKEGYEKDSNRIDAIILIKCLEVFNNMPAKDGQYYHYSLDTLTGLTEYSSIDNEYIHKKLGLNDAAINSLRQYTKKDIEQNREVWIKYKNGEKSDIKPYYVSIINFLLSSKIFQGFIELFFARTHDMFQVPIFKQKDKYKVFPSYTTEQYDYLYLGCDPTNPENNIPIRLDKIGSKVIEDILFDSVKDLIQERENYLHKESERIRKEIEGDK